MKKLFVLFLAISLLCLCGCAVVAPRGAAEAAATTLKGWTFQYNEGTNDYSLFFGLLNAKDQYISADVDVDVRITDESGNELYKARRSVSKSDFGTFSNQTVGSRFLAEVRIKASDIAEGTSSSGTVYLTVYKDGQLWFDEVNCAARFCLPVKNITLTAEQLPVELELKDYAGNTESIIRVEDVSYEYDTDFTSRLEITISGTKTYENSRLSSDMFTYKIYDGDGFVVDTGSVFLMDLSAGDKFRDDSITFYDAKPGEAYTIAFAER